jgi:MerR family transcriptional regulator, copper efflux regulator
MANVTKSYRSSELAQLAGVSTDTLRFYERQSLLTKPPRTVGNYRLYPVEALNRVRLVRGGLSLGFSVAELRQLLAVRDRGGIPCLQVRELAQSKLETIELDIRELQSRRKVLQKALRNWDKRINAGPVVARLGLLETFVEANPEATQRRSPLLPRGLRNSEKRKEK